MIKYLLPFLLVGCGVYPIKDTKQTKNRRHEGAGQDARVLDYVNSFETNIRSVPNNPIVFTDLEAPRAGVCYYTSDGYWAIEIDEKVWETLNSDQREVLVWHELLHCVSRKPHNDNIVVKNGIMCPESIMRSNIFNKWEINNCYTPFKQEYINELL